MTDPRFCPTTENTSQIGHDPVGSPQLHNRPLRRSGSTDTFNVNILREFRRTNSSPSNRATSWHRAFSSVRSTSLPSLNAASWSRMGNRLPFAPVVLTSLRAESVKTRSQVAVARDGVKRASNARCVFFVVLIKCSLVKIGQVIKNKSCSLTENVVI